MLKSVLSGSVSFAAAFSKKLLDRTPLNFHIWLDASNGGNYAPCAYCNIQNINVEMYDTVTLSGYGVTSNSINHFVKIIADGKEVLRNSGSVNIANYKIIHINSAVYSVSM